MRTKYVPKASRFTSRLPPSSVSSVLLYWLDWFARLTKAFETGRPEGSVTARRNSPMLVWAERGSTANQKSTAERLYATNERRISTWLQHNRLRQSRSLIRSPQAWTYRVAKW